MLTAEVDAAIQIAADWILNAGAILVGSGAGMGVDSGLGTYRGRHAGVWPPLETMGIDYAEICTPDAMAEDPQLSWAFWRHCFITYRRAVPHEGYSILQRWGARAPLGAFSYTTNVDSLWPRVFPLQRVYEAHGSTMYLQCSVPKECPRRGAIWQCPEDLASSMLLESEDRVVEATMPRCPACQSVARPNVLMFGDFDYSKRRAKEQNALYKQWLQEVEDAIFEDGSLPLVCLEIGAGRAVPTVRTALEDRARRVPGGRLIRINPEYFDLPATLSDDGLAVAVPMRALDALRLIDAHIMQHMNSRGQDGGEDGDKDVGKDGGKDGSKGAGKVGYKDVGEDDGKDGGKGAGKGVYKDAGKDRDKNVWPFRPAKR